MGLLLLDTAIDPYLVGGRSVATIPMLAKVIWMESAAAADELSVEDLSLIMAGGLYRRKRFAAGF